MLNLKKTVRIFSWIVPVISALGIATHSASAADTEKGIEASSPYFDKEKVLYENPYILHDYIEFSVFDMSRLGLFINSEQVTFPLAQPQAGATSPAANHQTQPPSATVPPVPPTASGVETVQGRIQKLLPDVPRQFYTSLKEEIERQKVPATLSAADSPAYAKPLVLYIKLKKIALGPALADKGGALRRPISCKIYGQIKDKRGEKVLVQFYDTASADANGEDTAALVTAFNDMAGRLMSDLAGHLRSKY